MNYSFLICLTLVSFSAASLITKNNNTSIYGVRWFLGQKFQFQPPLPIQQSKQPACHLMAMFNSYQNLPNSTIVVVVDEMQFECSLNVMDIEITEKHHSNFNNLSSQQGDHFETYIYRCPVSFEASDYLETHSQISYNIVIKAQPNSQQTIFSSKLRSPQPQKQDSKVLVFGDWGVVTNFSKEFSLIQPIKECLISKIESQEEIRLMLLLGDLAYDLEGLSYIQFFQNIQPISEKLVILLTPGNHQTIKHKDIYNVVKQSFYSPYWKRFMGYFDLVAFGQFLFFGYNPENVFQWLGPSSLFKESILQKQYGHLNNLLQTQLTPQSREKIRQHKLIAYSHYPIYCSEEDDHQSGEKYRRLQDYYYGMLNNLGLDLYFSGHLHIYQRSKPICKDGEFLNPLEQKDNYVAYEMGCPLYIIQGVAGNNYFVQIQRHYNLKKHSDKFVQNTGFGLLTLHHDDTSYQKIFFEHISTKANCSAADRLSLVAAKPMAVSIKSEQNEVGYKPDSYLFIVGISLLIVLMFVLSKQSLQKKRIKRALSSSGERVLQSNSGERVVQLANQSDSSTKL